MLESSCGRPLVLLGFLSLQAVFQLTSAVDRSKFRTCEQGSFCRRFKKWIVRPNLDEALWTLVPESRQELSEGGYSFKVKHAHEAEPHLELKLTPYESGVLRMRLNEIDGIHQRHVIPAGDVINDPPPPVAKASFDQASTGTVLSFTTNAGVKVEALVKHAPLTIEVRANGQHVQTLNSRNFLNFERYRKPQELRPPDAKNADADAETKTIDAAAHPHDLDKKGLWEEDFGGHTDRKPRGPASYGLDVTFEGDVPGVFGLPEHATKASLPFYNEPYRFFNLDVFEYEIDVEMALYGTIPMLWAVHHGSGSSPSVVSGFLWMAPSETFVKFDRADKAVQSWWVSESGVMDVSVFVGLTPGSVSAGFHALTGHAPMPGLWALGKHQCRWNYMNEKDVAGVDNSYDKHDIPYDVVWLDIEHTDGKKYFTWNSANFPTPDSMVEKLSAKKRKLVNVVDPHIKKDDNFHVFTEIRDKGLFVKKIDWRMMDDVNDSKPADWVETKKIQDPTALEAPEGWNSEEDGVFVPPEIDNPAYKGEWKARQVTDPNSPVSDFDGWCWPGTSMYPDFMDPKMRDYWGSQFALDKYKGTNADTYIWNDMNEPSVFNGPEVTMPRDAVHPSYNVEHRDVHNMYGYYVHRATFEGLEKRSPGDRPFVLTRSFFVGSHKYCAIWTGDNTAEWKQLGISIAMVGALALGGQSLVGADIGGFFKHPDAEMVTRWYQLAVLAYPFLRNHAHLETPRREPYTYDDSTMNLVKAAIQLRYKMLPLWYTLFEAYHSKGEPVVRPLFWDFLDDAGAATDVDATENQIMLGDGVLVHGVSKPASEGTEGQVYLPSGKFGGWYDLHTGDFYTPGKHKVAYIMDYIPAYHRAGTIVPLKSRIRRSSGCMAQDPLTLNVYLTPDGTASGRVYLDDYRTKAYQDGKSFLKVSFEYKGGVLRAASTSGSLPAEISAEVERVEIFGLSSAPSGAVLEMKGTQHKLTQPVARALSPASLHAAVVKVSPWINLQDSTWSLQIGA
jgi:alpha 1,3-glucosidase